jgi:hypothetical protein
MAHIWDSVSHVHSRFDLLHLAIVSETTGTSDEIWRFAFGPLAGTALEAVCAPSTEPKANSDQASSEKRKPVVRRGRKAAGQARSTGGLTAGLPKKRGSLGSSRRSTFGKERG